GPASRAAPPAPSPGPGRAAGRSGPVSRSGSTRASASRLARAGSACTAVRRSRAASAPLIVFMVVPPSQPALAAPIVLHVPIAALARVSPDTQVELLDVRVVGQRPRIVLEHDPALLHDVAVMGHGQRGPRVLLDHDHGQP